LLIGWSSIFFRIPPFSSLPFFSHHHNISPFGFFSFSSWLCFLLFFLDFLLLFLLAIFSSSSFSSFFLLLFFFSFSLLYFTLLYFIYFFVVIFSSFSLYSSSYVFFSLLFFQNFLLVHLLIFFFFFSCIIFILFSCCFGCLFSSFSSYCFFFFSCVGTFNLEQKWGLESVCLELWFGAKTGFKKWVCVCVCWELQFTKRNGFGEKLYLLQEVGSFGLKDHNAKWRQVWNNKKSCYKMQQSLGVSHLNICVFFFLFVSFVAISSFYYVFYFGRFLSLCFFSISFSLCVLFFFKKKFHFLLSICVLFSTNNFFETLTY
jgi:hypothetical protein